MARHEKSGVVSWLLDRMSDWAVGLLTKPLKRYALQIPNDIAALKRHIRKGDVILVEGNERISECIKYLTQSSWSHSALYVGDEPIRRNPEMRAPLVAQFGEDANFLIVEAIVEAGVVLSPLTKYRDFNLRVCRPFNLSAADLADVMDEAIRSVGDTYDLRNVIDLARYFLPVSLVPARFRRRALQFGSGEPTRVICSSVIASSFHRVKFPIVPNYEQLPPEALPPAAPKRKLWPIGSKQTTGALQYGALRMVSPTLVTPRDFDLSPYFEIIKFNIIENMRFDYHKILWADDAPPAPVKKGA
ncbi:YiiX/YebB-like N1pC/P60 family cysteine hydrolase [Candidatus Binatus sp.]|uniref:YiiX/YebB-like N1pC/P60 family cysteine hydrolase n=1 Tax=Candidatus Binatus sp. TaxID=2811406 RepID=UPI003C778E6A